MAPAPSDRPSTSPVTAKAPPTGPKASRGPVVNGHAPPASIPEKRKPFSIAFPTNAAAGPSRPQNGQLRPSVPAGPARGLPPNAFGQYSGQQNGHQQRYQSGGQPAYTQQRPHAAHPLNGSLPHHTQPNGSRQPPAGPSRSVPPPPPSEPPPPPPSAKEPPPPARAAHSPDTPPHLARKPPPPIATPARIPADDPPQTPPIVPDYQSKWLPSEKAVRAPVKISLSTLPMAKLPPRVKPSSKLEAVELRLETGRVFVMASPPRKGESARPHSPNGHSPPPPPPSARPPSPPLRKSPPPSPPRGAPPAPPPLEASDKDRDSASVSPTTSTSRPRIKRPEKPPRVNCPPTPPPPPVTRLPTPPPPARNASSIPLPPPYHFRDLAPARPADSESDDESRSSERRTPRRDSPEESPPRLVSPPRRRRTPTPEPAKEPEWTPPACFHNREAGSFLKTFATEGKAEAVRKDGKEKEGFMKVVDPRLLEVPKAKRPRLFSELQWDDDVSVGKKPLSPPTAVLITQLNPLTTADQIKTMIRQYGTIRNFDNKVHPKTGMQMGICWIQFDEPKKQAGKLSTAYDVAVNFVKACDGMRVGRQPDERIKVVLDGRGERAIQAVKEATAPRETREKPGMVVSNPPPVKAPIAAPPAAAPAATATPKLPAIPTPVSRPVSTPVSGHATPMVTANAGEERKLPIAVPLTGRVYGLPNRPTQPSSFAPRVAQPVPPPRPAVRDTYQPPSGSSSTYPTSYPARPPTNPPINGSAYPSTYAAAHTNTYQQAPSRPSTSQQLPSSFTEAPFGLPRRRRDSSSKRESGNGRYSRDRGRGYSRDSRDRSTSRDRGRKADHYIASRSSSYSRSPSRSRSPRRRPLPRRPRDRRHPSDCSTCDSDSDSDSDMRGRRKLAPKSKGKSAAQQKEMERTKAALEANGKPALYVVGPNLAKAQASEEDLKDHFKKFKPESILSSGDGFYVLFTEFSGAKDATFLDKTVWRGCKLSLTVKSDHVKALPNDATGMDKSMAAAGKMSWQMMTIGKRKVAQPAKPVPVVAIPKRAPPARKKVETDSEEERPVSRSKGRARAYTSSSSDLSEEEEKAVKPKPKSTPKTTPKRARPTVSTADTPIRTPSPSPPPPVIEEVVEEVVEEEEAVLAPKAQAGKKRAGTAKTSKKGKKARIESPAPLVEAPPPPEPEVAEITIAPKKQPASKKAKVKKVPAGPLDKLVADGLVEDEEDAYFLSQVLEEAPEPEPSDESDEEADLLPEGHPLFHSSGSWRAQGVRKVPHALKSAYLPQRNRAQAAAEATAASANGPGLTTGRTARVTGRRLALDMETHRKTTINTAESDLFAFNQLRIRKKQLRFARSAIEGYGLYAMETIQTGEMVCEYVGELIRSVVADLREAKYTKQGIGSSYLFRIDGDVVCDATFRGSVSRLINHSCDPSASAKIISINGQSKIVIYAKRQLSPGEEILYDYKFPLESDPALRVPCLCGSKICRGFLN